MSKTEDIFTALETLLRANVTATILRNAALPEIVLDEGLIILHDGDPGEPERTLGGFDAVLYSHVAEMDVVCTKGDAALDAIFEQIGAALRSDPTLGGLVHTMLAMHPRTTLEAQPGSPVFKYGSVDLTLVYEAPYAL